MKTLTPPIAGSVFIVVYVQKSDWISISLQATLLGHDAHMKAARFLKREHLFRHGCFPQLRGDGNAEPAYTAIFAFKLGHAS
jgi:hypothetical protein